MRTRWVLLLWWIVLGAGVVVLLTRSHEEKIVSINASREPDLGLPVYAQFSITQTVAILSESRLTRIEIPVYIPPGDRPPLQVAVRQRDQEIFSEAYQPPQSGFDTLQLVLKDRPAVTGELEISVMAPATAAAQKEEAPRVFIESADDAYPFGAYRIADNPKKGDMSLDVFSETSWAYYIVRELRLHPLETAALVARAIAMASFLASVPFFLVSLGEKLKDELPE